LRLNQRAPSSPPAAHAAAPALALEELGALSEDTDGSVPASPNHHPGMSQDDDFGQDQVTVCKWEGCDAGDLENMDRLVEHLHDDHIGTRQKKYSCEWSDCTRKGIPHASGYALRAHMRSHTREKPFYCTLPECDRSFTRSDALAKHMRTVHETEALRPSDPVPKHHSSNPSNKFQRLKLVLTNDAKRPAESKGSTPASPSSLHPPPAPSALHTAHTPDADLAHNNITYIQDLASPGAPTMVQFPPDVSFTAAELALPADALFHSLRRTLQFATDEGEALRAEADALEKTRKAEWDAKEVLLENYMECQIARARRERLEQGLDDDIEGLDAAESDVLPSRKLAVDPRDGRLPWWREDAWVKKLAEARESAREKVPRLALDGGRTEEPVA
ncbi:C2H2 finger domain protein, partial [Stagonosporopsis vannaccii]